jgi:hypothetical protein
MRSNSGRLIVGAAAAVLLVAIGAGVGMWLGGRSVNPLTRRTVDEKVTLSLLRSEALAFLVTRRTVTQIVVEYEESDLLGEWRGVLWATVSWRWGVDMTRITEKDIRRQGQVIVCRLPEPQLLDFALEPGSVGFMSRSTAVPKLLDLARGGEQRRKLEECLRTRAMEFAGRQGLCPSREEVVRQLNDAAGAIRQAAGVEIRFE